MALSKTSTLLIVFSISSISPCLFLHLSVIDRMNGLVDDHGQQDVVHKPNPWKPTDFTAQDTDYSNEHSGSTEYYDNSHDYSYREENFDYTWSHLKEKVGEHKLVRREASDMSLEERIAHWLLQKQKKEVASKDEGTAVKPGDRDPELEPSATQSGRKIEKVQDFVHIEVESDNHMGVKDNTEEKFDDNDKTKVTKNNNQGLGNGQEMKVNTSTDQDIPKNDNIKVNSNIDQEFGNNDKVKVGSNTGDNIESESQQLTEEQSENGVEDGRYWNKAIKEDRKTVLSNKDTIERSFLDTSLVPKYNLYDEILKAELENETGQVIQRENVDDQFYEFQENEQNGQALSNNENGIVEQEYDVFDESYIGTYEGVNKNRKNKLFSEKKIVGKDLRSFYTLENFVDEQAGYPIKSVDKSKTDRNPVMPQTHVSVSTFKARVDVNEKDSKNVIEKGDKDSKSDLSVDEIDSSYVEVLTDKTSDSKKIETEILGKLKKQDTEQETKAKPPKPEKETSPDANIQQDEIVKDVRWHDITVTASGKLSEAVKRDTTKAQAQQNNLKSGQMTRGAEQNSIKINRDLDVPDDNENMNITTETKQPKVQSSKKNRENESLTGEIVEDTNGINNKSEATLDKREHQMNNSNNDQSSEISGEEIILKEAESVNVSADYIPLVPAEISIVSESYAASEKIVQSVHMENLASDLTTVSNTTISVPKSTDNVTPRESDSKTDRNENETNDQSKNPKTQTVTVEVKTTESRSDLQNGATDSTGKTPETDQQHLIDVLKNVTRMEHEIIDIVVRGSLGANNSWQLQSTQNNSTDGQKGSDKEQDTDHNVQAGGQTVAGKVSPADLTKNRQDNGTENNTKPKTENSQMEKHNNSNGNSDGEPDHNTNENIAALISKTIEGETLNKPPQLARHQTDGVDPSPSIKNGSVIVSKTARDSAETVPFTGDSREMHEDLDGVEPLPNSFGSSQEENITAGNSTSENGSGGGQNRETSSVVGTETSEGDSTSITNKSTDTVKSSQSQSDSTSNDSDSVFGSEGDAADRKLPETADQPPVAYRARVPKGKVKRNAHVTSTANNITDRNITGNDTLNSSQSINDKVSPVNDLRQKDTAKINETTSSVDVNQYFPINISRDVLVKNQTEAQSSQSAGLKKVQQGSRSGDISEAHTWAEFNKSVSAANNESQSTSQDTPKESTSETTSISPKIIHMLSAPEIDNVNAKNRNSSISSHNTSRSLQNKTLDNNDDDIVKTTNSIRLQTASKVNKTVTSDVGDSKKASNRNKDKLVTNVNNVNLTLSDDSSNFTDSNTTEDSDSSSLDLEPPSNYTTTSKTSRKLFSIEEESTVMVVNDTNTIAAGMNDSNTARPRNISRAENDTVKTTSTPSLRDLLSPPSDTAPESRNITSPNSSISSINRNTSSTKTTIASSHPNKTSSSLSDTTMKPSGTSKELNKNDTTTLQLLQENHNDNVKPVDGSTKLETKQTESRAKPHETQKNQTASGHLQNTKRILPDQVNKKIADDNEQSRDKSEKEVVGETTLAENSQLGPVTHRVDGKKRGDQPDPNHLSNGPENVTVHNDNSIKGINSSKNNNIDEGNNNKNMNSNDSKNVISDNNTDQMARAESKLTSREIDVSNYRDTSKSYPTENNSNKLIQITKENDDEKKFLDEKGPLNDINAISISNNTNHPSDDVAEATGQDDSKPLTDSVKNNINNNNNNNDNKNRSSSKRNTENNKIVFTSDILQGKSAGSDDVDPTPKAASEWKSGLKRENSKTQHDSSAKSSSNSSRIQTDKTNAKKNQGNDDPKDKKYRNQSPDDDITSANKSPQADVKRETIQAEAATRDSIKKEYDPVKFLRTVGGLPYFGSAAASVAIPETSAYKVQDFSLSVQKEEPIPQNREKAYNKNNNSNNNKDKDDNDNKNEEDNADGPDDCDEGACGLDSPLPIPRAQAAVSAVLTTHFGPTKDKMVPFDLELLDLADNYDNTTGMFICTIPGTYVISLYLMSHPGAKVNARVFINNRPIAALWADDSKNAGFYPSSSTQTIAQLGFGDQVYVMLVDGGYGDSWVHANYNVFTIFLLYEQIF